MAYLSTCTQYFTFVCSFIFFLSFYLSFWRRRGFFGEGGTGEDGFTNIQLRATLLAIPLLFYCIEYKAHLRPCSVRLLSYFRIMFMGRSSLVCSIFMDEFPMWWNFIPEKESNKCQKIA